MLEPQGPLPSSVYWRRRWIALAGVLLAFVLASWGTGSAISALCSHDEPATVAAPQAPPAPADPATLPGAASRPASFVGPGLPPPGAPPGSAAGLLTSPVGPGALMGAGGPDRHATPSAILPAPSIGQPGPAPAGAAAPGPPGPSGPSAGSSTQPPAPPGPRVMPPPPAPPAPPAPCADRAVRVAARTDKPRYGTGEKPLFSVVITNVGGVPCVRDLDAERQAVAVVRTPGDGLWGSNDCSPVHTDDTRTLAPGQEVVFSVRWAGRTSSPGCSGTRTPVPPGAYELLARLDRTVSEPVPFVLE